MRRTACTRLASLFAFSSLLAFAAGCGDSQALPVPPADGGTTNNPRDMAQAPDMTTTPDMTPPPPPPAICRGTRLENTCVATFLAPAVECFHAEGSCTRAFDGVGKLAACWASGASMQSAIDFQQLVVLSRWTQDRNICLEARMVDDGQGGGIMTFRRGSATLVMDEKGNVTCPDGSHVAMGDDFGGCDAIRALLDPDLEVCVDGTCG